MAAAVDAATLRRDVDRALRDTPDPGRRGARRAGRGVDAGAGRHRRAALLRLRHRRRAARRDRGRHAGGRLGPVRVQRRRSSPAAAVAEEVAGGWLKELLGLPRRRSVGFVTGAQARQHGRPRRRPPPRARPRRAGTSSGTACSARPAVRVVASVERHATIDRSLRLLGFGTARRRAGARPTPTARSTSPTSPRCWRRGRAGPTIVCLQAGQREHRRVRRPAGGQRAWPATTAAGCTSTAPSGSGRRPAPPPAHLVDGVELADSWSCDGHKWLNVPYDCGFAFCAHPPVHAAAAVLHRGLPHRPGRPDACPRRPRPRVLTPGTGFRRVGGAARAGPGRRRRARRAVLPAGPPVRRRARGRRRRGGQRRRPQPGAGQLRRRRAHRPGHRRACSATAPAGSAARPGAGAG